MNDVIVCSYATERAGMLDEYENSLAAAGIDFHLEIVSLPQGIGSVTARWKFEFMARMAEQFSSYQRIIFTDAWDVMFIGGKEELLPKIPEHVLVSAERNCWPEADLADQFSDHTPWRFCNAGMISGHPHAITAWVPWALGTADLDMLEQAWFNRRYADTPTPFVLDETTSLFYTVSFDREGGELQLKFEKPWNSVDDTHPQFFHFAGPCSSVPFRALLRGAIPSLCASA